MANLDLTPEILRIVNPKRPLEPKEVAPPEKWTERELYLRTRDVDIDRAYDAWKVAKSPEERAAAQEKLDEFREKNFAERKRLYETHVAEHVAWQQMAGPADAWLERTLPALEARGLLQYDADTGSLDMHPAIRHTALRGLSPDARSSTGSHVSDVLSSRPAKPFEEARTREDLALVITRVEALNAAGKLEDGWDLYQRDLEMVSFRLQYFHERLELLQPYFPQGWENRPVALPADKQDGALSEAAMSLHQIGKSQLACVLYTKSVKGRLQRETLTATGLGNLAICVKSAGQPARAERFRSLAIRLAEADEDDDDLLWLKCNLAINHIQRGRLRECEAILVTLREATKKTQLRAMRQAHILRSDLDLAFRTGCLSEPIAEACLKRIRSLGERNDELESLHVIALWRQASGRHDAALDALSDLIALANEIGSPFLSSHEACRALSLAALGRQEEARRVAAKVDSGKEPPHVPLALLYLEVGDQAKARAHALAGYKEAWGEGPPYHDHWDLEDCRKVLAAVGEPEPALPPFDPSKVEPFDFEPDVERLIEKKLAEKAKEVEEKAKRDAARQAAAAKSANAPKQP